MHAPGKKPHSCTNSKPDSHVSVTMGHVPVTMVTHV